MNTIIRPKDRAEWLEHRKHGIGSSEVATILGLNPWETPYQLWRRKKGFDAPKTENFAMKAGHYLEDAVSQFWADATGREVIKSSAGDWLFVNSEKDFLRASPDRTFWIPGMPKNNENKGVLECKTTQMSIDAEDLPKHWFCQVQYLLGVAEFQQGSLAWLCSGREFGYKDIAFVPDFYGWMVEEVERFWVDNLLGNIEPEAITAVDVITKYARHTDDKIRILYDDGRFIEKLGNEEIDLLEDESDVEKKREYVSEIISSHKHLKEVKQQISALEDVAKSLEEKIKLGFGDAEAISYGGQTLATWKAAKDSAKFDSKAFCKAHPDLAQEFTHVTPGSRRLIIK